MPTSNWNFELQKLELLLIECTFATQAKKLSSYAKNWRSRSRTPRQNSHQMH